MGNLWLRIKLWTKGLIIGAALLYVLAFLLKNTGQEPVKLWFWFNTQLEISPLLLVLVTFLVGVIATILVRTTFTTLRQFRELRQRSRIDRLEREQAEMKAKAAMMRTKSAPAPAATTAAPPPPGGPEGA